jgi:hypothetical protein
MKRTTTNSVDQFIHTLHNKLGYSDTNTTSTTDYDWVFSHHEAIPLLQYLTHHLTSDMVLDEDQVNEFKLLERQGRVLRGKELEDAYQIKINHHQEDGDSATISNQQLEYVLLNFNVSSI